MYATGRSSIAAAVLGAAAWACGSDPVGEVEPGRHESEHFVVLDYVGIPPVAIDSFVTRLEADYRAVAAFLPDLAPPPAITAVIRGGWGLPYMTRGAAELTQWAGSFYFDYNVHLLVHIWTDYRGSLLFEEGLAVYGTEVLVPGSRTVDPYRGQVPHAWMSLYAQYGTVIPFETLRDTENVTFDPDGSAVDASAWQFFVHAGSFTRWVHDEFGADAWWRLYDGEPTDSALGLDAAGTDARWIAAAQRLYPDPIPCRIAVGSLRFREGFWCAITEGR